jgi:predicted acetylornithine/succinylornithine family transaminase
MTIHELEKEYFLNTYNRFPIEISHGEEMYLIDKGGNRYLDLLGGVAVNALGYGNEKLISAVSKQAAKYMHVSNYFVQQPQLELAKVLCDVTNYSKVFFCNSGTEASEGALKIARKWGSQKNKCEIISMENSFHGRTMGSLSMMSSSDYREGFGPYLDNCKQIPFNDVNKLKESINENTAAIFFECIQGEGGIFEVSEDFVSTLNELRKQFEFLVMIDEVQSGMGRTGKFFSYEHYGLNPDLVTLAKPLGGGLPLGAILVKENIADVLKPGMHGTTFGGNPIACAAGKIVLDEILNNNLMQNAKKVGNYFKERLQSLADELPDKIKEVRGKGLMLGLELNFAGKEIVNKMLENKIIINCTHNTVLRFLTPFIIEKKHVDQTIATLREIIIQ